MGGIGLGYGVRCVPVRVHRSVVPLPTEVESEGEKERQMMTNSEKVGSSTAQAGRMNNFRDGGEFFFFWQPLCSLIPVRNEKAHASNQEGLQILRGGVHKVLKRLQTLHQIVFQVVDTRIRSR